MKKERIIAAVLILLTVIGLFSACGDKKENEETKPVNSTFKEEWVVSPTIEAQAIDPFVRADFNDNTNHYDISFDRCFKIMQNSKYGIIDYNGKVVVKPKFDDIIAIRNSNDYIGINTDSKGNKKQTYIHSDTFNTETAYKKYNSEKYEYYWNTGSSELVFVKTESGDSKAQNGTPSLPEAVCGVTRSGNKYNSDGTYGLYFNSANVTGMVYAGAGCFSDGKAAFMSNGKWGYIDSNGRTVIPFEYDSVCDYSALGGDDTPYESFGGFVTLCKDKKFGVLKSDGTVAVPFNYDDATPVVSGRMYAKTGNKWGLLLVDKNAEAEETTTKKTTTEAETTAKEETTTTQTTETTTEETEESVYGTYILSDARTLRESPEYNDDNIILTVDGGNTVYVDSVDGYWGHISFGGESGWINLSGVEKVEEE